jgi:uncharacterized membrane protein
MKTLGSFGRICYGIGIVAFGLEHLVHADFVTRVVPYWPDWLPGHAMWAYVVGVMLIACGAEILSGRHARAAALSLGGLIFASVVLLYIPLVAPTPTNGGLLTSMFKAVALSGGAFAIARSLASNRGDSIVLLWIGRAFFGAFLVLCGVLHFIYRDFVATLVPAWIPGSYFWTYFAGIALIAGGTGINIPPLSRFAATLTGVMIFIWFLILHIPRSLAQPHNVNELTAVFEALAMSGIAFVLAGPASSSTSPVGSR